MIQLFERVLHKLGLHLPATRDDVVNAEIDDKAREHSHLVDALHEAFSRRKRGNEALRAALHIAKQRTNSFADFERLAIGREDARRD